MNNRDLPDHYEVLQLSPQADHDTIVRVYRYLAKRFHPDNLESGDAARFSEVNEAFHVLGHPEQRVRYDVHYDQQRQTRWRVFDQESALDDVEADRQVRKALLSLLYTARRNDAERPGIGILDVERTLGCPEVHMRFHIWYLRERGLVERLEDGKLAITAAGVDHVLDRGGPEVGAHRMLPPANGAGSSHHRAPAHNGFHA